MGKEFDSVQGISYTEVADYLKELKEKDPGGLGDKLRPMDMMYGELAIQYDPNVRGFHKTDSGDVLCASDPQHPGFET